MVSNTTKLVAFDLGYTLVFNAREEYYIEFLKEKGISIPRNKIDLAFHYADKTFMKDYLGILGRPAQYHFPWYLGVVNYHLGQLFDLNEQSKFILDNMSEMEMYWQLFPWSKSVLKELKDREYQVGLLSNWDESCRSLLKKLGVYDLFDHILVSSEIGIEKPDRRVFELLMEKASLASEEIVYVGDNYYDDVKGSRKVGIETILINRFGKKGIEEIEDCHVIESTKELLTVLENNMVTLTHHR